MLVGWALFLAARQLSAAQISALASEFELQSGSANLLVTTEPE